MQPNERDPFANSARDNPFAAPRARVDDPRTGGAGSLLGQPRGVSAGRGWAWFGEGWSLFLEAPGTWIGLVILMFVLNLGMALIPVVNFLSGLIWPVLSGGLMLGCRSLEQDRELTFGHLFEGFRNRFGTLMLVGLLYFLGTVIIAVGVFLAVLGTGNTLEMFAGGEPAAVPDPMLLLLAVLVIFSLMLPLVMAIWFAPALVVLHGLGAMEAMGRSFRGCLRNLLPFLVYGLAGLVLTVLATLPVGLGWLVLVPVLIGSTYRAYRDIFTV